MTKRMFSKLCEIEHCVLLLKLSGRGFLKTAEKARKGNITFSAVQRFKSNLNLLLSSVYLADFLMTQSFLTYAKRTLKVFRQAILVQVSIWPLWIMLAILLKMFATCLMTLSLSSISCKSSLYSSGDEHSWLVGMSL